MSKLRLIVSIEIEEELSEEETVENIGYMLNEFEHLLAPPLALTTKVTLIRDGDRSEGNLLLPRLQGGHLQNKRAKLLDVIKD